MKPFRFLLWVLVSLNLTSITHGARPKLGKELLYRKDGPGIGASLGQLVVGGKRVDGDGWNDFIIAVPAIAAVFVYSGVNGALLFRKDFATGQHGFGASAALVGDCNGDGRSEFIIGAPDAAPLNAGAAFVYSGADGSLLYEYDGDPESNKQGSRLGYSVAEAGDVNADGKADFIIGSPNWREPLLESFLGKATVFSGATGGELYTIYGSKNGDQFGYKVNTAGNINGDTNTDFMISAPGADPGGLSEAGSVYVYSGLNGNLLYQKNGSAANERFGGWSMDGGGDLNGDGRADFIIGAPQANSFAGSVYVYSGLNGNLLYQKNGAAANDHFGYSVAVAEDTDEDGLDDFLVGSPDADPGGRTDAGSCYVYSGYDGSTLGRFDGSSAGDYLGSSVDGCGLVKPQKSGYLSAGAFILGAPGTDFGGLGSSGSGYVFRFKISVFPIIKRVDPGSLPQVFHLEQNYPNPFNPTTLINYALPVDASVSLAVFDVLGRRVAQLVEGRVEAGYHIVELNASGLASGLYFYRITATGDDGTNFTMAYKLMVLK